MTTVVKAIETDVAREFDSLVTDIIAGNADVDIELDWLSEYLLAHWGVIANILPTTWHR